MNKPLLFGALALLFLAAGCQNTKPVLNAPQPTTIEPKAKATSAEYGGVSLTVNGNSNEVTMTIGDGAIAANEGNDTQRNTATPTSTPTSNVVPTQTNDIKPEVAVAGPGGSAGTGNAKPGGNVLQDAFNKLAGIFSGTSKTPLTKPEADALKDCIDGNCGD